MAKLSKSAEKRRAEDLKLIARATSYAVHLQLGPVEVLKSNVNTLQEARRHEMAFNAQSAYGRRAVVYAITPEGRQVPLD
jgi:hypothetical protein